MAQTVGGELLVKQHLQGSLTHSQYTPIYSHYTHPSVQLGPSNPLLHTANRHRRAYTLTYSTVHIKNIQIVQCPVIQHTGQSD